MNIFDTLNWILKNNKKDLIQDGDANPFIINRWLSMIDSSTSKIINITTNRWLRSENYDFNVFVKFNRCLVNKTTKKISYIKKTKQEETDKSLIEMYSKNMELSKREIEENEKMKKLLNL
jgi:hypothetical protein